MIKEPIIAASILSGDFVNMSRSVSECEAWGTDWIHCDVMDGVYVKNFTFGMPMVTGIKGVARKPLDVHLMITNPERHVEAFAKAGAKMITFHPEASENASECLDLIKRSDAKAGIALNPDVDIEKYEYLFDKCDMVLVMTVFAGYGGQSLIEDCLTRISRVRDILIKKGLTLPIEADGGIDETNFQRVLDAGASVIVAGSSIFKSKDPKGTIKNFHKGTLSKRAAYIDL
jgi:ribulose-phosphate 3-epimerase